jgi:hypothetical protein
LFGSSQSGEEMVRNLIIGFVIGAAAVWLAWLVAGRAARIPGGESDFAGSRSFSEPWKTGDFFNPEKNVLPPEVEKILKSAKQFTLLSLDPAEISKEENERLGPTASFHGFRILGKTEIDEPAERATLVRALLAGIADANGQAYNCFDPRHGISATVDDDKVDLVICFECLQIYGYLNDKPIMVNGFVNLLTSRLPRPLFNEAVKKAGLPQGPAH